MSAPRTLTLNGSPRKMGLAHGHACGDAIRRYTAGRVALAGSETWAGHAMDRAAVLALATGCLDAHHDYAPDLMIELEGIAEATGLSPAELIITNGFTDFIDFAHSRGGGDDATECVEDDCTAFIVPDHLGIDGHGWFGQTWDMHAGSAPFVILLQARPDHSPGFIAFSLTGCLGMIGMNDAGIAIGINNLLGAEGQAGVSWPFVVRKALQQTDIDAASACVTGAVLMGAHNFMLFDRHGHGINIEAMPGHCQVTHSGQAALVHTNHCLAPDTLCRCRPRPPASQASSEARLSRAQALLEQTPITTEALIALTRDPVICVRAAPPLDMQTCGAAIMQPAKGMLWVAQGLPSENGYAAFGPEK
ncbi:hypothetical protein J5J83_09325 [Azoarcus sp. L1K30]|uniref:C45 family autoproteolytic acyltransferase/hydolase n=1 Tax=Azoarcus sp. L1K30 TaxID=2820277 RepID=UPI001B82390D|nr:C45 family peptidase [Azoarcus sp. L1K30]MBR0566314.1 hypothetical protein [Azoarcus sp. L1K30]